MIKNKNFGIYIHIPFCRQKCVYCDFYSVPGANAQAVEEYISSLKAHFRLLKDRVAGRTADTVFFGGGTPSLLSGAQVSGILDCLYECFDISPNAEISLEANPATFDAAKLALYRRAGVNRLSIGMQSANDGELGLLGRIHNEKQLKEAFDAANRANFDNIGLDLMYGIPDQTVPSFRNTLSKAIELHPSHISVYGLQLEEGTPLYVNRRSYSFPNEDAEKALGRLALEMLTEAGYRRYEISNYSLPHKECKHNLRYWHGEEYLGFGAAAHSFLERERYNAPESIELYKDAVKRGDMSALELEKSIIDKSALAEEYIILRMRLAEGIDRLGFESETGADFSTYEKRILPFVKSGHIERRGDTYRFTAEGFDVSNYILSSII